MALNKKLLQFLAALGILIFHLWTPITGTQTELFLVRIGYVGVDLFFFLAAYSLADKKIEYKSFLKDRLIRVYGKFVLFVVVMAIYKNWTILRVGKVLLGIEFLEKGGGSFLWFVPAIMLFYILYPLFLKAKHPDKAIVVLVSWFALSIISERGFGYTQCFIFTNRLPVMMAGYLLKTRPLKKWIPFVCIPVGIVLLAVWGNMPKLNVPLRDFYYVLAVVLVVGIAGISAYVPSTKLITLLGSATIEMYALQMMFGATVVSRIFKATKSKAVTDLLMLLIIFAASLLLAKAYDFVRIQLTKAGKKRTA